MTKLLFLFIVVFFCFSACNKKTEKTVQKPVKKEQVKKSESKDSIDKKPSFTQDEIQAPLEMVSSNNRFYLISASFSDHANAERYQKSLLDQGLSSEILTRDQGANSSFYKVSYMSFNNRDEAFQALNNEKNIPGKEDVWLLIKN